MCVLLFSSSKNAYVYDDMRCILCNLCTFMNGSLFSMMKYSHLFLKKKKICLKISVLQCPSHDYSSEQELNVCMILSGIQRNSFYSKPLWYLLNDFSPKSILMIFFRIKLITLSLSLSRSLMLIIYLKSEFLNSSIRIVNFNLFPFKTDSNAIYFNWMLALSSV